MPDTGTQTPPAPQPYNQSTQQGVPYERFHQVNENMKANKTLAENLQKQLDEANKQIEEFKVVQSELTELKTSKEKLQSDYETMINQRNESAKSKWNTYMEKINVEEGNKNFERNKKIMSEFATGEDLSIDDINKNISLYETFDRQGLFKEPETSFQDNPKGASNNNTQSPENIFA